MDYDAIVTQALTLLQREQRLSYRVLKLRLQLDDTLEAPQGRPDLCEKAGGGRDSRVLVWIGSTPQSEPTTSPMPPATSEASPTQVAASPGVPAMPDAERRQPCCSVTWWTRPCSPASSIRKTSARWCGPTSCVRHCDRAPGGARLTSAMGC